MKKKFTIFLTLFFACSSLVFSQQGPFPKMKRENADKKEIYKAAVQANSVQNNLTDPLSAAGSQRQTAISFSTEPGKISSYVPGEYYVEGFEDESLPSDWQTRNISGDASWTVINRESFAGKQSAYIDREYSYGGEGNDWLISPRYMAASGDSLIFYIRPYIAGRVPDMLWVLVSTQVDVPADGPSLEAAFNDTLLVVPVETLQDGWYRYSAPLGDYAGQQIYIGFKEYNKNGCGVYLDDISFGPSLGKDAAYSDITLSKFPTAGASQTIYASFVNKGYETESFDVICEIPAAGYSSSKTISALSPGSSNYVDFSWTPENTGKHQIIIRSTLAGDEYAGNDAYIDTVNVVNALNPAAWTYKEAGRSESLVSMGAASYIKKTGNPARPFEGGIYILGGRTTSGSSSNSIHYYDINTRQWSQKSAVFPAPIYSMRAVQVRGKIYIPGGYTDATGPSSSLYIYDVESDAVTQGADMLEASFQYSIGVYKDSLIYVMGGPNNKVQIYNINTNSWAYGTPMLYSRSSSGGSIAGNKIVIAGGYSGATYERLSSAEVGVIDPDDPYQITWTLDEYPAGKVSSLSGGSWYAKNKEYIFFTGGWREETYGSSIIGETWAYDVQNDKWLSCPGKLPGDSFSDMVPVYRNDSVFIAVLGGSFPSYFGTFNNEWLYIGDYDDPLSAYNKDIAAVSAVQPDTVIANSPALFEASFKNRQLTTRTFDVKMVVAPGGYTSVKTVNSLAYKETSGNIAFDPWTPAVGGDYTVKIFPVIEGDEDASNDTLTLNIYAQKVDVVAKRIKNDVALYPKVKTTPTAYFANAGDLPESFNVTMEIAQASYASVKSVSNLAPGDTAIVAFEDWTPDSSGNYAVKIYSSLPDDENKVNDTLLVNLHVQKVDAAVSRSLFETPVFAMTATIPKAYLVNYGEQKQTFSVVMRINESSYASVKTVEDLPAGDSVLVLFDNWNPAVSGTYHAGIYISPSIFNDEDKANDTLRTSIFVEKTDNSSTKISIASLPYSGKIIIPKASFENRGTHSQTFMVSMSIAPGGYYSEKTVTDLAANAAIEVEFNGWTPAEAGAYNVKIYSGAVNDEDKTNDTLKTIIYALDELNAGAWHSEELIPEYFYNKTASSYTLRYAAGDSSFIFIISPYSLIPGYEVDSSHSYNTVTRRWIDRQAPGCDLINYKAIYAGGKVYLPGGVKSDAKSSNMLFVYNPINNQWTREADLPEASSFHALGVYGDSLIYVIGGANVTADSVAVHNEVQIYNIKSKTWKAGTAFEGEFKKSHAGGIIKNKIVLAGGLDYKTDIGSDQVVIGTIDSLNPYSITWETSVSPASSLYGMASAACNSKQGAYVIFTGGRKTDNTFSAITLAYDPVAGKWYRGADAINPSALSSGVTIARNDSLYFAVLGGENGADISGLNDWLYLGEAIRDTNLIGVGDKPLGPLTYSLSQNYPNPFNPSTIIRYSVANAEQVDLKIYNILGQEVLTLVNEFKNAGIYEVRFNAAGMNLSSGVYIYRIRAGKFVQTKKLVLIK